MKTPSAFGENAALRGNSWRPQRDLNPRCRRERPVSLPLDDGVVIPCCKRVVSRVGFEPTAYGLKVRCSAS